MTADYGRPLLGGALKLGYDFEFAPNRNDHAAAFRPGAPITSDPAQYDVFQDTETDNEAYLSYERRLGKLALLTGVRAENAHFDLHQTIQGVRSTHDYARLFPNLHLAYQLGNGRQLTASYTWRTNAPNAGQLDPFVTARSPIYLQSGNPNLKPDDQAKYELAFEQRRPNTTTTITFFYHRRSQAFHQLYTNLPDGVLLAKTVNAGVGQTLGGEWAVSGKLPHRLQYNISWDQYWISLATSRSLGVFPTRAIVTGFGHAGLTWRITPKDLAQVDFVSTAKGLDPQGYLEPTYSGDIGYRHLINSNVSLLLAVKDPFHSLRWRSVENIGAVEDRRLTVGSTRSVSLTLVWNFAGKPREQGFDFGTSSGKQ